MRKKLLLLLLINAMSLSLIACGGGSKKEEATIPENEIVVEDKEEDDRANWSPERIALEEVLISGMATPEQKKSLIDTYEKFPAVSDWKNVTVEDCAIQIDDMLYVPGCTVGELLQQVENSSVEYGFYIGKIEPNDVIVMLYNKY